MRAAGVIDSLMVPMRYNHVGGTTKKEDFIWLGYLTNFFVLLIRWPNHLLIGSIREDNVTASFIDKKFPFPEFQNIIGTFDIRGIGE